MGNFKTVDKSLNRHLTERISKLPKDKRKGLQVYDGKLVYAYPDGSRMYIQSDPDKYLDSLEKDARNEQIEQEEKEKRLAEKNKIKRKRRLIIARNRAMVGTAALLSIAMAGAAIRVTHDYNKWKRIRLDNAGYTYGTEARTGFRIIESKHKGNQKEIPDISFKLYYEENGLFLSEEEEKNIR
jgi:hypothetical protein